MNSPVLPPTSSSSVAPSPPAPPRLLAESVGERLRDMIVQGELAPGVDLNERVLCEQLGISRTPLREALKALASEGLVELAANRGARVAPVTMEKVREVFRVMGALEALAGQLACENATEADIAEIRSLHYQMVAHWKRGELAAYFHANQAIHLRLVEAGGNAVLAATYRQLNAHVRRARYMANLSPERWARAVAEHEQMLAALDARDSAQLTGLLNQHLGNKMLSVLEVLDAPSGQAPTDSPTQQKN